MTHLHESHENNKDNFKAHNESQFKECVCSIVNRKERIHKKSLVAQVTEFMSDDKRCIQQFMNELASLSVAIFTRI